MHYRALPNMPRRFELPGWIALSALLVVASFPREVTAQDKSSSNSRGADSRNTRVDAAIRLYLNGARLRTLTAAKRESLNLPKDFLDWIDSDPVRRASVYGCRKDPLPVLLQLLSLEIDLGEDVVRREYPQLAIAFAIQTSYRAPTKKASGWNDGDAGVGELTLPSIEPRPLLQLEIPSDPRVTVNTKDPDRKLDRDDHIINFLEDHAQIEVERTTKELPPLEYDDKGVAKKRGKKIRVTKKFTRTLVGADVIASAELQKEFRDHMATHGHDIHLDCGDQVVHWQSKAAVKDKELRGRIATAHELFHTAYRNKGRMPAERDRAPSPAESMAWLIPQRPPRIHRRGAQGPQLAAVPPQRALARPAHARGRRSTVA